MRVYSSTAGASKCLRIELRESICELRAGELSFFRTEIKLKQRGRTFSGVCLSELLVG